MSSIINELFRLLGSILLIVTVLGGLGAILSLLLWTIVSQG